MISFWFRKPYILLISNLRKIISNSELKTEELYNELISTMWLLVTSTSSGMHRSQQISARKRKNFATMTDSVCQAHHLHRDFYCFSRNIKKKRGKHCLKNKKWFSIQECLFLLTIFSRVRNRAWNRSLL